jgi:hypothetical protein
LHRDVLNKEARVKENVGHTDRIVRSIAGTSLILLGYTRLGGRQGRLPGLLGIAAGATLLESAVTRVCPLNAWLGWDSRSRDEIARDWRDLIDEPNRFPRAM